MFACSWVICSASMPPARFRFDRMSKAQVGKTSPGAANKRDHTEVVGTAGPLIRWPGRPDFALSWGLAGASALLSGAAAVALGPIALALPLAALGVVWLVRRPPILLAAFLNVGIFKGAAVFDSLPVDITAVLGLLLAGVCVHRLVDGRMTRPPLGLWAPVLVIAVLAVLSLAWTPVPDYGSEKAAKFVTFTLLSALAPFFVLESRRDLILLLWALVALAALAAGASLADPGTAESGRFEFGGRDNTILTSRLICIGALVLLLGAGLLGLRGAWRLAAPVAALGLLAVAAGIGSRGPLISLALAIACVLLTSILRRPRQLVPAVLAVAAGVAVFPFVSLPETSRERLAQTIQNPAASVEEDGRAALYRQAVEITDRYPLRGIGTGGFFLYSYVLADQEEKYPHNIFLELSAEFGLLPALLLALSVLVAVVALYTRTWQVPQDEDRRLLYLFGGLFLFNLFAVQFSGDINDNRVFWAMLGVVWLLAVHGIPGEDERRQPGRP
jgi:O-antigen ligase